MAIDTKAHTLLKILFFLFSPHRRMNNDFLGIENPIDIFDISFVSSGDNEIITFTGG